MSEESTYNCEDNDSTCSTPSLGPERNKLRDRLSVLVNNTVVEDWRGSDGCDTIWPNWPTTPSDSNSIGNVDIYEMPVMDQWHRPQQLRV